MNLNRNSLKMLQHLVSNLCCKVEFAISNKLKKMQILGGIADGKAISAEEALAYAELPSRDELLAKLVYVIGSPLSGIAQVCAGPARGLVTALQAVADKQAA